MDNKKANMIKDENGNYYCSLCDGKINKYNAVCPHCGNDFETNVLIRKSNTTNQESDLQTLSDASVEVENIYKTNKFLINLIFIFYFILQLIILGISLFVFTSTMKIFPWYEILSEGVFFVLMIITPIQILLSFIIWGFGENLPFNFESIIISNINSGILIFNLIIAFSTGDFLNPINIICSIFVCLLALSFIITLFRPLIRSKV